MGGDGGLSAAALPVDDTDMLSHAEAPSWIFSKPFIASSARSTRLAAAAPDQPRQKCSAASKIAAAAALNMGPDAGEEGRDRLQVVEAPEGGLQPAELFRQSFGVDLRRQGLEQGLAGISQFLRSNARAMPIIERAVASLGPLLQEFRMERPDAGHGEILSRAFDEQGIDGSVSFQPIFAFDPIVELNDKAREFRRGQFGACSLIGGSAKGRNFSAENGLECFPEARRGKRGKRLPGEDVSLAHRSQLGEDGFESLEQSPGVFEAEDGANMRMAESSLRMATRI